MDGLFKSERDDIGRNRIDKYKGNTIVIIN